jgi:hypothetical protein
VTVFFAFFFCGWPKFLKEDMCLKTVPPPFSFFFLEGVASGKKNQDTRPGPSGGGGGGKKRKKKRKKEIQTERNSSFIV